MNLDEIKWYWYLIATIVFGAGGGIATAKMVAHFNDKEHVALREAGVRDRECVDKKLTGVGGSIEDLDSRVRNAENSIVGTRTALKGVEKALDGVHGELNSLRGDVKDLVLAVIGATKQDTR